ncbi:MAG: hypothetical protein KAH23_09610 [Kiritimatiellae bacterium]|nr:hypothetical protein [Kiritimatiellia bacterium]
MSQGTISAAPKNANFYVSSPPDIPLGDYPGFEADAYLRFVVTIPKGHVVGSASFSLHAHTTNPSNGNNVHIEVSMVDPATSQSVDVSSSATTTADTSESFLWSPDEWVANEIVTVDITDMLKAFVERTGYEPNQYMIVKLANSNLTSDGHYRAAFVNDAPVLNASYVVSSAGVNGVIDGFQTEKSYCLSWQFADNQPYRWVRVTTENAPEKPSPIIDLKKRLRFHVLLTESSVYLTLGIREIAETGLVGEDGGTTGPVEWVNVNEVISADDGSVTPVGILIEASEEWQEIDIDLLNVPVKSFQGGNNELNRSGFGVLEHLAFTINPDDTPPDLVYNICIDEIQQVDDLMISGTSQGMQVSTDFGGSWDLVRLTNTPVHKFYRSRATSILWAVTSNEVFLSVDPTWWFPTTGLDAVQSIRDIAEDTAGNIYISTDRGVYFLEIALIRRFTSWRQTAPVTPFSLDTFALYYDASTGNIWVSTEVGIYVTSDEGLSWTDTGFNTSGFVAYKIENISSNPDIPILIALNRKHVLRKYDDGEFEIIADLENQQGVIKAWTFAYFAGRLFVSTEAGMLRSTGDLLTPGSISVSFDKTMGDLGVRGEIASIFNMNIIDLGPDGTRMFIGQENRLWMVDEDEKMTMRVETNGTLPSFLVDGTEEITGYTYNGFNNVVIFREALPVTSFVSATYLPRRKYMAENLGWAHSNPNAEIFIYLDAVPKWIYFAYDVVDTQLSMSTLSDKLAALPELTDYNRLYPDANEYLAAVQADIAGVNAVDEDGNPLPATNESIVKFMEDYSRFRSLIIPELVTSHNLTFPQVVYSGQDSGTSGSRAVALAEQEQFEFETANGIKINVVNGVVDFPSKPDVFAFDKYDKMNITIFNANIGNAGDNTHAELEDSMEGRNTGLSSQMGRSYYANMIKTGIFLEGQHNYMFDRYNASNIQSRFYAAYTNDWYDILNSTIDYSTVIQIPNETGIRFAWSRYLFSDADAYLSATLWVGTDNGIIQVGITEDGAVAIEDFLTPGGTEYPNVIDIFGKSDDEIYIVVTDAYGKSQIKTSTDRGLSWTNISTTGLPDKIYTFRLISGSRVVGTEIGIYYADAATGGWFQADITVSTKVSNTDRANELFRTRTFNLAQSTWLIGESGGLFYSSNQGIEYFANGLDEKFNVVNKIVRHKNFTWMGTNQGLYHDSNSILSDQVGWGLQNLETSNSDDIKINDIAVGEDAIYAGASNGKVYRYYNLEDLSDEWLQFQVPDFGSIQQMAIYEGTEKHILILISYNKIKAIDVTTTGELDESGADGIWEPAEDA